MIDEIHSPKNLKPEDYSVIDYLDNQRPRYAGGSIEGWRAEIARWESDWAHYFPHWRNGNPSIHHCHHCGNGNVRYISIVKHTPTSQLLAFGSDCVHKLEFANRDELKLAQLKARAEQGHARLRVWTARNEFLSLPETAELKRIIDEKVIEQPSHAANSFARDILHKLDQYGTLSPRQIECLIDSLRKDDERANRKIGDEAEKLTLTAAGIKAPVGRQVVEGTVLSTRMNETAFGPVFKWLVKLTTGPSAGTKVWTSIPSSLLNNASDKELRGKNVRFTATFEHSPTDPLFAFGSRPTKGQLV